MSSDRRDLYSGFGDTFTRAFEIVVTPLIFGLIGWWIDGRLGTRPALAIVFGLVAFAVEMWKLSKGYLDQSKVEDRKILKGREL